MRFCAQRIGTVLAVLWGAASIGFVAVKLIPGDPVAVLTPGENVVDAAERAVLMHQYGLDQPLAVQSAHYVVRGLTGDLGESYQYRQTVIQIIVEAAGPTLQLAGTAVALAAGSALATAGRNRRLRAVFSGDGLRAFVLPAVALSWPLAALLAQVLRDGLEEALAQPFALTVCTRGVGETALLLSHGLRHAALAASTLTGTLIARVLGGSVLTETVFGRSGVGQITLQAIKTRNMPLVLGLVMLSALAFVLLKLPVDALYVLIDPRLRRAAL